MAFKSLGQTASVPDSPEKLLLELPRRKIPAALLHQGEVMRSYAKDFVDAKNLAIQLPTGSGKTLVALLISEWRRRKNKERIVYLCPTKQLVNQVVYQANEVYGLDVQGFTGSKHEYSASAKASYQATTRVAVTTYNSLFNTKPFFVAPDVIVIDDAHASESYLAAMWTISISRADHPSLHNAMMSIFRPLLSDGAFSKAVGDTESLDSSWVDKIPTPSFLQVIDKVTAALDVHSPDIQSIHYPWQLLREHLSACHVYLTEREIYIRPLVPPSWTHAPFMSAKQRIFMSATLGAGGDLERLTGIDDISRLPVPEGWDRQGIGRRFFLVPEYSLDPDDVPNFNRKLIKNAGRAVYLVPSLPIQTRIEVDIRENLGAQTFGASSIEETKQPFVTSKAAVAVIANRYDGIDFPGSECRLLIVQGLPRAANPQERFLMSRMAAGVLLRERVQTRFLQAIGRCTRSAEDYSAVVVIGEELTDFISDVRRRQFLHPELQAELIFGIQQSTSSSSSEMIDNFNIFLANGKEWEEANQQILKLRDEAVQQPLPSVGELASGVRDELRYQAAMWQKDYVAALSSAEAVLSHYTEAQLRGYRALWHYLAGSAATLASETGLAELMERARGHYRKAKAAATQLPWLVELAAYSQGDEGNQAPSPRQLIAEQVERLEGVLLRIGLTNERKYAALEKEILDGLSHPKRFEQAHMQLGRLLGFDSNKVESDASPDPWWRSSGICFVFEDNVGATNGVVDATKARQAASHPAWIRANVKEAVSDVIIISVLVTTATAAQPGALPSLENVLLWPADEFCAWARDAMVVVRQLREICPTEADLDWRAKAAESLETHKLDAHSLHAKLIQRRASSLVVVGQ